MPESPELAEFKDFGVYRQNLMKVYLISLVPALSHGQAEGSG